MTKRKWKLIGRPEPKGEGQRFFVEEGEYASLPIKLGPPQGGNSHRDYRGASVYVADNSGYDPDDTDDGPLRLDTSKPIVIGRWCGRIGANASVFVERSNEFGTLASCGFTMKEAAWLVKHAGMYVEIKDSVRAEFEAFGKLYNAPRSREPEPPKGPGTRWDMRHEAGRSWCANCGEDYSSHGANNAPTKEAREAAEKPWTFCSASKEEWERYWRERKLAHERAEAEATGPDTYLVVEDRLGKTVFAGRGTVVKCEPAPRVARVAPQDIAAGSLRAEDNL